MDWDTLLNIAGMLIFLYVGYEWGKGTYDLNNDND